MDFFQIQINTAPPGTDGCVFITNDWLLIFNSGTLCRTGLLEETSALIRRLNDERRVH